MTGLAERLRAGETLFSGWSALPEPLVAEACARAGFDCVTLDMQHGLHDIRLGHRQHQRHRACRQAGAGPHPGRRHRDRPAASSTWAPRRSSRRWSTASRTPGRWPPPPNIRRSASGAGGRPRDQRAPRHRRAGASRHRQRHAPRHRHDRDAAGDRGARRNPRGAGHRRCLRRPVRPVADPFRRQDHRAPRRRHRPDRSPTSPSATARPARSPGCSPPRPSAPSNFNSLATA